MGAGTAESGPATSLWKGTPLGERGPRCERRLRLQIEANQEIRYTDPRRSDRLSRSILEFDSKER
jgi:hypothetical protein